MATDLILGTAGHIDHGKTSLVRALTGVDTDRLPEEKQRGITIDLGFAELDLGPYRLGIVDVPGHERFVRNMLAGATGVDLALLVVAADDSVKLQTREHLDILRLLEIETGIIALTKCDLPEPDWIDLVEEEVRELVKGTFLESAALVRTSVTDGSGIDQLRDELTKAAERAAGSPRRRRLDGPFRMAIDRAFTLAGHGTVVTGSVASGRARLGDEMMLEPGEVRVRIRGLHNHDTAVEEVHGGQRAAINLAGVHHEQIARGQELATPGHLVPSKLLTVQLQLLDSAEHPLKHRARVRCHVGTSELMCTVMLLERDRVEPGQTAYAQLFISDRTVTTWSQPLVLRSESPVLTIGGGRVLDPHAARLRRGNETQLEQISLLASADPLERSSAALYFAGLRDWQPEQLARTAGVDDGPAMADVLRQRGDLCELTLSSTRALPVHRLVLDELFGRVETALEHEHRQYPLRAMLDRSRLVRRFDYLGSDTLVEAMLAAMQKAGRLLITERGVALPGHGPQLSSNEQKLVERIIEIYREAGFQPPTVAELQAQTTKNQAVVPQLVSLAAAEGQLIEISPDYYLHAQIENQLRATLAERLAGGVGLTMSQIREILATTRKYAVPICEYLDRIGFTQRQGDLRVLAADAQQSLNT